MGIAGGEIDMVRQYRHARLRDANGARRHRRDLARVKFHEGVGQMLGQQDRRRNPRVEIGEEVGERCV